METKEYNEYQKKWEKYWKDEDVYYERRAEYIREGKEWKLEKLDKDFGHSCFNARQFGPFTLITDPSDLLNHNFILPGYTHSFYGHPNTDHAIPTYFGKRLWSELDSVEGVVVGYGYDAYDDYIQIRLDTGELKNILVNSKYTVKTL